MLERYVRLSLVSIATIAAVIPPIAAAYLKAKK
jgi:hypothetical protein